MLEKATPAFWKYGFADTSVQGMGRATGVNKPELHTEFRDKEDLL
jgi:TetR/AcrR family transcriptional regulator, copper-responsive repressor